MATPGDMREETGMVALCFEKNTFLDVAQLPEDNLTGLATGHRRCRSDSAYSGIPKELSALTGDVVAWPEFRKQERCPNSPAQIKCRSGQDTADTVSEVSTGEWQGQQRGMYPNSPGQAAERGSQSTSAELSGIRPSHADPPVSTHDVDDIKLGLGVLLTNKTQINMPANHLDVCREPWVASLAAGADAVKSHWVTAEWASEASTVDCQGQPKGGNPRSLEAVRCKIAWGTSEWASEASTVDCQGQQKGWDRHSPVATKCQSDWDTAEWPSEASIVEWQGQPKKGCLLSPVEFAGRTIQTSAVDSASFGHTSARPPLASHDVDDLNVWMGVLPTCHPQRAPVCALFSDQGYGNVAITNTVQGKGIPRDDNQKLTSGSLGHAKGQCMPCAHVWRPGGCIKGDQCGRCHLCDEKAFRKYRREHRRFSRALKRAGKRAQLNVVDTAATSRTDVVYGSPPYGRQVASAENEFHGNFVPQLSVPCRR